MGEWTFDHQLGRDEEQEEALYPLKVVWRSILIILTGVVILPLLSFVTRRPGELPHRIATLPHSRIALGQVFTDNNRLIEELKTARKGRRLVFTNGCFDISTGHVRYLQQAKAEGTPFSSWRLIPTVV
ncbi:MAG: hypothetical protein R2827_09280 [Bdellovibrionales bacterium]